MSGVKTLWRSFRSIPDVLELRLHESVLNLHRGEDVGEGTPVCFGAHKPRYPEWPCEEFLRADRAFDEVRERLDRRWAEITT